MRLSLAGRRKAFTLVELLVVIAIIGVLVALLLPAVQAARESARRMKCSNNMKQLGLALHNHHDATGFFPAARHAILQGNGAVWVHSWTPKILPYIEQQALFEKYRFDQNWDAAAGNDLATGPIRQALPVMVCPTAPMPSLRGITNNRGAGDYAATTERNWPNAFVSAAQAAFVQEADPNYIGVLGHDAPEPAAPNAAAIRKANRRMGNITDGTSNTFLLAECAGRNQLWQMGKRVGTITRGPWANPDARLQFGGFDPNNPSAVVGPCTINCSNDKEIYSFHVGGATTVFADGSVRFIKTTLQLDLLYALLTRERGENIPTDL